MSNPRLPSSRRRGMLVGMAKPVAKLLSMLMINPRSASRPIQVRSKAVLHGLSRGPWMRTFRRHVARSFC